MIVLTKVLVEKQAPKGKEYVLWDSKLTGFGLKVLPSGRKVYIYKYRTKDGRQRKPSVGVHGSITCEQARKLAEQWSAEKTQGNDPSQERIEKRRAPTVNELCDMTLEKHSRIHKKASGADLDAWYMGKYIKPALGMLKVSAVNQKDISNFHSSLHKTPAQANRMLSLVSKMFNLAEVWDFRPRNSNPVVGTKRYKEESKERFLSEEEIHRLGEVLKELEESSKESPYVIALIRLLLLTGARLGEVMTAQWDWIDKERGLLYLPDSKTGKKVIHLSPAALNVLEKLPHVKGNPYIIVGYVEGKSLYNAQKPWRRIRKLARLDDVRLHDLRHTFASMVLLSGQGSLQMVAKLLGHSRVQTSERYAHLAQSHIARANAFVGEMVMKEVSDNDK